MRIGTLRHRITFQEPIETRDSYGSVTITWSDMATVYAAVWPIGAKEFTNLGQTQSEVTHRVRIRYRSDIITKLRIKFGERYFNILQATNPDERNIMLELMCKEEVD